MPPLLARRSTWSSPARITSACESCTFTFPLSRAIFYSLGGGRKKYFVFHPLTHPRFPRPTLKHREGFLPDGETGPDGSADGPCATHYSQQVGKVMMDVGKFESE
jgi:hypothetical protein